LMRPQYCPLFFPQSSVFLDTTSSSLIFLGLLGLALIIFWYSGSFITSTIYIQRHGIDWPSHIKSWDLSSREGSGTFFRNPTTV
jgi:hypothetical protein